MPLFFLLTKFPLIYLFVFLHYRKYERNSILDNFGYGHMSVGTGGCG